MVSSMIRRSLAALISLLRVLFASRNKLGWVSFKNTWRRLIFYQGYNLKTYSERTNLGMQSSDKYWSHHVNLNVVTLSHINLNEGRFCSNHVWSNHRSHPKRYNVILIGFQIKSGPPTKKKCSKTYDLLGSVQESFVTLLTWLKQLKPKPWFLPRFIVILPNNRSQVDSQPWPGHVSFLIFLKTRSGIKNVNLFISMQTN